MEHQLCFESYVSGTGDTKWKHAHTKQESSLKMLTALEEG